MDVTPQKPPNGPLKSIVLNGLSQSATFFALSIGVLEANTLT